MAQKSSVGRDEGSAPQRVAMLPPHGQEDAPELVQVSGVGDDGQQINVRVIGSVAFRAITTEQIEGLQLFA
jgi:hypothetical protein